MAVRASTQGDRLTRLSTTVMATSGANFTTCGWMKRKSGNGFATGIWFKNSTTNLELFAEMDTGVTVLHYFEGAPAIDLTGPTMTADVWYFVCLARTNTSRAIYYGTEAGGTLTKVTDPTTNTSASGTINNMALFDDVYTEFFNGEMAYVRCWDATLNDAEVDAEWRSTTPVKASVRGDWRLTSAATATTDSSGNSLTLTSVGSLIDGGTNPVPPQIGVDLSVGIGSLGEPVVGGSTF